MQNKMITKACQTGFEILVKNAQLQFDRRDKFKRPVVRRDDCNYHCANGFAS